MICPNCRQEIHCLHYSRKIEEWGIFDSEGIYQNDDDETIAVRFNCPECDELITEDSEIAYELMNREHLCPVCGEREVAIDGEICQDCQNKKEENEKPF